MQYQNLVHLQCSVKIWTIYNAVSQSGPFTVQCQNLDFL